MKYKLTYRLYNAFLNIPEEYEVITEEPDLYINRVKSDLEMVQSDLQLGSYVIEPINHLKLVKNDN
jgi:hypothetical protein